MIAWSQFQKPNTGLLFYKHVYKEPSITDLLAINDKGELIINIPASEKKSPFDEFYNDLLKTITDDLTQIQNTASTHSFTLYTTYPGLLTGSVYQHDTKAKGDYKIGFFFDHTTGQPVIPGSSVKGILRSLFELDMSPKTNEKAFTGLKSVDAMKFICDEIIENLGKNELEQQKWHGLKSNLTVESLTKLKIKTFGDQKDESGNNAMGGDVFFDSVINVEKTGKRERVFSNDFITPHDNPLKNPTPLQFLKVLPNIAFDFKFIFTDADEWTKELKEVLFKQILLTLGAGAKTNVGYGQFSLTRSKSIHTEKENNKQEKETARAQQSSILDEIPEPSSLVKNKLSKNSVWSALIYRIKNDNCLIQIMVDGEIVRLKKKLKNISFEVKEGDHVTVTFIAAYIFKAEQFSVSK